MMERKTPLSKPEEKSKTINLPSGQQHHTFGGLMKNGAGFKKMRLFCMPSFVGLIFLILFLFSGIGTIGENAYASQITLAWDDVSEASGYKIYYGTASNSYTAVIDVGNTTTQAVNLTDGHIYYFAATAYDDSGLESDYSNEVVYNTDPNSCTYTISPSTASFSSSTGTGTVTVTTQVGCTWMASSAASWVTITSGTSGTGSGKVSYSVASNSGTARTTVSTIAGKSFTVNQGAPAVNSCTYSVSASSKSFYAKGGSTSIKITANGSTSCAAPTVLDSQSWISESLTSSGANVWYVKINATANSSSQARAGTVTVANKTINIYQKGAPCNIIGFTPASQSVSASGGSYSFTVNVFPEDCSWSVPRSAAFLHPAITSGTGDRAISYTVDTNNSGIWRSGIIRVRLNSSTKYKDFKITQYKQ